MKPYFPQIIISTVIALTSSLAFSQTSATPITVIVPYSAGGASDSIVRAMGKSIAQNNQTPVVIENKPGGGTFIAAQALMSKPADGSTVLLIGSSTVINPYLQGNAPYDIDRDFAPVSGVAENPHVLVVNPDLHVKSLEEYLAHVKEKKGDSTYSSFGNGSSGHLGFEVFKQQNGLESLHVPYKGGAPALMAVLSGEVEASFADIGTAAPHITSGKLHALAVAGSKRSPALPNVPTFREAGAPDLTSQSWFVLVARKGTPETELSQLSSAFTASLKDPEVKKVMENHGMEALFMKPASIEKFLQKEAKKFQTVIQDAKIEAN